MNYDKNLMLKMLAPFNHPCSLTKRERELIICSVADVADWRQKAGGLSANQWGR